MTGEATKVCTKCGSEKDVEEFHENKGKKDGLSAWCRSCKNAAGRLYHTKNRAKRNAKNRKYRAEHYDQLCIQRREYYAENREQILAQAREYRAANVEKFRTRDRNYKLQLRKDVLDAYGRACACCGEETEQFLAVDHVNGDGAAHRREIGGGGYLYLWLKRNDFPKEGFQLLCWNCNSAKGFYGRCPHTLALSDRVEMGGGDL